MKNLALLILVAVLAAACGPDALSEPPTSIPPTAAPPTQPPPSLNELAAAWEEALNAGNIDVALSFLAEDAVVTVSPAGPEGDAVFAGAGEIRGWYQTLVAANGITTLSNCVENGEGIACLDTYTDEGLQSMGVDYIEGDWVANFRDGKIQSYSFTTTPESLAKLAPPPEPTTLSPDNAVIERLAGTYLTSIGSEGGEYGIAQGQYLLRLTENSQWFVVDPGDGFTYVQGNYDATADRIVLSNANGPVAGSCYDAENSYEWSDEAGTLTFVSISVDPDCGGEEFFFTQRPFTPQP